MKFLREFSIILILACILMLPACTLRERQFRLSNGTMLTETVYVPILSNFDQTTTFYYKLSNGTLTVGIGDTNKLDQGGQLEAIKEGIAIGEKLGAGAAGGPAGAAAVGALKP